MKQDNNISLLWQKVEGLEKTLAILTNSSAVPSKTEFTYNEAAQFLGVSVGTVRTLKEKGILPYYEVITGGSIRKRVRFKKGDLEQVKYLNLKQ